MMNLVSATLLLLVIMGHTSVFAQVPAQAASRVEWNVVYGMYSGLALLMDVHHPQKPNGYGIIYINGSGWHAPMSYGARPLKEDPRGPLYVNPLLDAGYTVFVINHRAAPRFRYPAAVEDAQRAVRYARHHAKRFGVSAERIGAAGGSSGGHLVSLLGVLDGKGNPDDINPVNRESAKVQCVVTRAAPSDFLNVRVTPPQGSFMGMLFDGHPPTSVEYKTYREASPAYHVSRDDPPYLLIHGDADESVAFKHSELMEQALKQAGVSVKLLRIEGGGHSPDFRGPGFRAEKNWPNYLGEMVRWFDQHLRIQ